MGKKGKSFAMRQVVRHIKEKLKEVDNPKPEENNLNPSLILLLHFQNSKYRYDEGGRDFMISLRIESG